ncbi:MAG: hypothetical protein AB8G99_10025 [Planctomycetaceae bacterium]
MAAAVTAPTTADVDNQAVCDDVASTASARMSLDCEPLLDVDSDMLPE